MIQASTRGAGKHNLAKAMHNRLPFKTGGALKGVAGRVGVFGVVGLGRLNKYERELYRADDVVYTVISYETPIAWVRRDGRVHKVDQKWTPTTSKHQSLLYLID